MSEPVEVGKRYGRVVVLHAAGRNPKGHLLWMCRCDCGVVRSLRGDNLKGGKTVSCGCKRRTQRITHGKTYTPEYDCWRAMMSRCLWKETTYRRYRERGIKVCERWQTFENFYADMGPKPSPAHSIDRIDNDGDYEPGNCRWATVKEQGRNKRTNRMITISGVTRCLADWCDHFQMDYNLVFGRLRIGWDPEEALSTPRGSRQYRRKQLAPTGANE